MGPKSAFVAVNNASPVCDRPRAEIAVNRASFRPRPTSIIIPGKAAVKQGSLPRIRAFLVTAAVFEKAGAAVGMLGVRKAVRPFKFLVTRLRAAAFAEADVDAVNAGNVAAVKFPGKGSRPPSAVKRFMPPPVNAAGGAVLLVFGACQIEVLFHRAVSLADAALLLVRGAVMARA